MSSGQCFWGSTTDASRCLGTGESATGYRRFCPCDMYQPTSTNAPMTEMLCSAGYTNVRYNLSNDYETNHNTRTNQECADICTSLEKCVAYEWEESNDNICKTKTSYSYFHPEKLESNPEVPPVISSPQEVTDDVGPYNIRYLRTYQRWMELQ